MRLNKRVLLELLPDHGGGAYEANRVAQRCRSKLKVIMGGTHGPGRYLFFDLSQEIQLH